MQTNNKLGKIFIIIIMLIPSFVFCQKSINPDAFYVASWNVENLFDDQDDPATNDSEFLPGGRKNWTIDRLETKIDNLAKVMLFMNEGCGPDIIGFTEVENSSVLKPLAYKFNDRDYVIAHRESPDERGIDNALFYDRNIFVIDKLEVLPVDLGHGDKTRDILHVSLNVKNTGDIIHVFVNHWPSRVGGTEASESKRIIAARVLKKRIESLQNSDENALIIILGDFNDEPSDISIKKELSAEYFNCNSKDYGKSRLYNLASEEFEKGNGTLMYRKDWEMFDQIIVNGRLISDKGVEFICGTFKIVKPPFMISKKENEGGAPIPTFRGNEYLKGYSDHYPVSAMFRITERDK